MYFTDFGYIKNKALKNDVYEKWNKSVHVYQDRLKILWIVMVSKQQKSTIWGL